MSKYTQRIALEYKPAKEKTEHPANATACSAAPDTHGFWWWQRKDAERWEMVKVMNFGDGALTAYSCEGSWGGWSLNVSPDRFAGKWVKISPPNV